MRRALAAGVRTSDIAQPNTARVSTRVMGDTILRELEKAAWRAGQRVSSGTDRKPLTIAGSGPNLRFNGQNAPAEGPVAPAGKESGHGKPQRRSVLRSSVAVAAAGTLARPYIANAAATTADVWWVQGFAQEEDVAFKKIVADYEKASGNTIDYSIIPYAPGRQKIVSAVTSGVVPDLCHEHPGRDLALYAWEDKLVDVSDVVETQREEYTETALLTTYCYNNVEKKRSFYGVPYTIDAFTNHIWRPLVEKAGYKIEDIPKTWDAYYDFFKDVQKKLREQRHAQRLRPRFPGDHQRR